MELDWRAQLAKQAAAKLGHQSAQLDVAAARSVLASGPPGQQKGTLLAFLTLGHLGRGESRGCRMR
eukprot:6906742-Pyramimonas_sp.AAC.1